MESLERGDVPAWAETRIQNESGRFIEAYRVNNDATIVHYQADGGNSVLLFRDSSLAREASLIDVLESRLNGNESIDSVDQLAVSFQQDGVSGTTTIEGRATIVSENGVTRQSGFTLSIGTSSNTERVGTRSGVLNSSGALRTESNGESTNFAPTDGTLLFESQRTLRAPLDAVLDRATIEFWIPSDEFNLDTRENPQSLGTPLDETQARDQQSREVPFPEGYRDNEPLSEDDLLSNREDDGADSTHDLGDDPIGDEAEILDADELRSDIEGKTERSEEDRSGSEETPSEIKDKESKVQPAGPTQPSTQDASSVESNRVRAYWNEADWMGEATSTSWSADPEAAKLEGAGNLQTPPPSNNTNVQQSESELSTRSNDVASQGGD